MARKPTEVPEAKSNAARVTASRTNGPSRSVRRTSSSAATRRYAVGDMPWQSLNASRTRRSETPAAALRSFSVTRWYRTLAAYRVHAHTMCTLEGRARGAIASRSNLGAASADGPCERARDLEPRLPLPRLIDDPELLLDGSPVVRCGPAARWLLRLVPPRRLRVELISSADDLLVRRRCRPAHRRFRERTSGDGSSDSDEARTGVSGAGLRRRRSRCRARSQEPRKRLGRDRSSSRRWSTRQRCPPRWAPASNAPAIARLQSGWGAPSAASAPMRTSASSLGSSAASRASPAATSATKLSPPVAQR